MTPEEAKAKAEELIRKARWVKVSGSEVIVLAEFEAILGTCREKRETEEKEVERLRELERIR